MSPHGRTVLRDLGVVLHVPGIMAAISLVVAAYFTDAASAAGCPIAGALSLTVGQLLFRSFRSAAPMRLRHAMVTAVLSWLIVPAVGAVPFLAMAWGADAAAPETVLAFRDRLNAFFESMPGFTSTGLSVADHPSLLPESLQWWRSFSQWVGGVGVILLLLAVFHPSGDAHRLYFSEAHGTAIVPDLNQSVRTIWWIYLGYTGVAIVLLWLTGMDGWQAVTYGMTGIAIGGSGVTDGNLGDFDVRTRLAMMLVMLAGAISFAAHFRILTQGRVSILWKDPEHRTLFIILIGGAIFLAGENYWAGIDASVVDAAFQWTSALFTAGFQTVSLQGWSATAMLLLSIAMICGGAAGATTGGLKIGRVLLLAQATAARVRGLALHPWRLMEHKPIADSNDHAVRTLEAAAVMLVLWLMAVFLGTVVLNHAVGPTVGLDRVVLEASSALGNVGLTAGITGPELAWNGKLALIVMMWAGRLEIVPILVLAAALIVAPRRRRNH